MAPVYFNALTIRKYHRRKNQMVKRYRDALAIREYFRRDGPYGLRLMTLTIRKYPRRRNQIKKLIIQFSAESQIFAAHQIEKDIKGTAIALEIRNSTEAQESNIRRYSDSLKIRKSFRLKNQI